MRLCSRQIPVSYTHLDVSKRQGDVLAGMISGLAAQKTDIFDAVSAGVYFHACGGDEARKKKGSYSVLARDLIDGIGQCLKNAEERL